MNNRLQLNPRIKQRERYPVRTQRTSEASFFLLSLPVIRNCLSSRKAVSKRKNAREAILVCLKNLYFRETILINEKWLKKAFSLELSGSFNFSYYAISVLRDSLVARIGACRALDRGSIPRRGVFFFALCFHEPTFACYVA